MRGVDIGRHLNLTPSAVSKLAAKGRADSLATETEEILYKKE